MTQTQVQELVRKAVAVELGRAGKTTGRSRDAHVTESAPFRMRVGEKRGGRYAFTPRREFRTPEDLTRAIAQVLKSRTPGLREILVSVHE